MAGSLQIRYCVEADARALAVKAAEYLTLKIEAAVTTRKVARVALSGGSTPKAVFALLADPSQPYRARIAWEKLEIFWVDERMVPPDHAESNYRMTREALLDHVPMRPEQIHRMEGELDPEVAAARYESELRNSFRLEGAELPCFDVLALGMGPDGHTASIFPNTEAIYNLTSLVTANHVPQKETWRLTLTWPVINQAREVFFLISGKDKAETVRSVWMGERDVDRLPSQLIRPAGGILALLLDKDAARLLSATAGNGEGLIERKA
ncbi:6-phosphogluconolactonase [Telmatobacter bradus]|uniref:6-phosphogluconolactonase n=1 Tax=Telmatobacter bradus TaxID=474953 RepID=UPI003B4327A9